MKKFTRLIAFVLMLMTLAPTAFAAKATPTPPPIEIAPTLVAPPAEISNMLDIAYAEWETLNGEKLPNVNKFTEWRGKGYKFEWCAGYVTWCMMEAGIPMQELADIRKNEDENDRWHVDGLYHCQEASPGKLLRAYQIMDRATMVPQKGFIVLYGCSYNKVIHAGIVYDVQDLGDGKYRLTTLEGNIKDSIKMYIRDYDMNAEVNTNKKKSTNLTEVPENERIIPASNIVDYTVMDGVPSTGYDRSVYYVNRFLMPWVPGDQTLSTPEPAVTPTPTPAPTPAPTVTPVPTPIPTETPAATEAPAGTEAPVIAQLSALTAPVQPATAAPAAEQSAVPTATAVPTPVPTPEPTATLEPTATPEPTPEADPTWKCQGQDGQCVYVTRSAQDAFCRRCDRNDNGVEDTKE